MSETLVLLTDNDDRTLLVRCQTPEEAHKLGNAAIWSDGGVSAWLVEPEKAVQLTDPIIGVLREGGHLGDVDDVL